METSLLGSPRSSSGYGSCEEDHGLMGLRGLRGGCFGSSGNRQRRISYTAMSCSTGSAPLTPDSSPSEPASCLNSPDPFSLDFQSVFQQDDVLPDWTNTDDPFDSWSQQRQSELFEPFETKYESLELTPVVKVEPPEVVSEDELLVPSPPPERHILVSLLKRPKAELDWITTGETTTQTSSSSLSLSKQKYLKSVASNSTTTTESAMPSPLQRLKALTNSNVVNHGQLATTTTTSSSSSSAVLSSSRIINSAAVPHSLYPIATVVPSSSSSSLSSSSSSSSSRPVYQKPTVIVATTTRQKTVRSVSCAANQRSAHKSPTPSSSSLMVRQQSSRLAADKRQSFAAAGSRTLSSSGGVRRLRTELDDHRYSSLQLPPSSSSSSSLLSVSPGRPPTKTQRLNNNNARTVASQYHHQQPSSYSASSSILETLLLTSEPLRPNEGSEASLAACGITVKCEPPGDVQSSILEHLLTGNNTFTQQRDDDVDDDDDHLSTAATTTDNYALFSEHLLFDSQGFGLFADDDNAASWMPSCLDDSRVMSTDLEEMMQQQSDEGHSGSQDDTWLQQYLTDLL